MNFSTNHNLRRFLSMALVLVMMTMLFAGCKKDAPVPETESSLNLNLPESTAPSTSEPAPTETTAPIVNENTGTVTGVLSIRSSPSTEATIVGTLYAGDKVEVSRREVVTGIDWAYILEPESGWVVMEFIEMDMPSQQPAPSDSSTPAGTDTPSESTTSSNTNTTNIKAVVNASGLYIRSEASKSGKIQGSYNKGDSSHYQSDFFHILLLNHTCSVSQGVGRGGNRKNHGQRGADSHSYQQSLHTTQGG